MASLTEKLLKTGSVDSFMMTDSKFTSGNYDSARTRLPVLNIALGGCITGGIGPGLGTIAGPSKHFKSSLSLFIVGAYLKKHKDAVCVFYDNEFGITDDYLKSYGVDPARVIHTPIKNVEDLKFDAIQKLEAIEKGERVIFLLDSMGNLASKKEVEDAQNEKSVADMSRAKQLKSFYRMITPYLTMKEIPFIQIAHTYECGTKEMQVKTPSGNVSLADLKVGDMVYTTNGIEPVLFTTKHEDAWVWDIELEDGTMLSFTEGHRFKVNGEWKYVHDLNEGDVLDTQK